MESADIIPMVIGALVLAGIVMVGIYSYIKSQRYWDRVEQAIDEEYDLHEALKFAKEMRKIARASEVYEPDEEISRLTTENRRLAQKLQSRLLRRLLEKGPYPDADADENGKDKETA